MVDTPPEVVAHRFHLIVRSDKIFKRARRRTNASLDTFRNKLRQQVEQAIRIIQALACRPVGHINLLLHTSAVKSAVREAVYRENITLMLLQPLLEFC